MKNITSLNEEAEQFIDEIEHINMEEKKINEISDEYRHYYGEENDLRGTNRENYGTEVERLEPSMEGNSYKSVSKQI